MPKVKSHSGAKKRFKLTATGKVKHGRSGKRHLLSNKAHGRKKTLKASGVAADMEAVRVKSMLPYA
jgi:large subunit ribosomal protein L35